jgi:hypothetical protein
VPPQTELQAIGFGSEPGEPLTLFLNAQNAPLARPPGVLSNSSRQNRSIIVFNSETLAPTSWAPPQGWVNAPDQNPLDAALSMLGFALQFPKQIVGSRNGTMLVLPRHLLVLSPRYSILAPFPNPKLNPWGPYNPGNDNARATGSITGLVAASENGAIFRAGVMDESRDFRAVTPCGRYEFVRYERDNIDAYEVRTLEGRRPLFRLDRIAALEADSEGATGSNDRRPYLAGDKGPLVVASRNGNLLQIINFDIGQLAREIDPNGFHVVSQPAPAVVSGGAFEYQIQVNNPGAVTGYKLRSPVSNAASATISPSGALRFSAPQNVNYPTQIDFSIEIVGRNDRKLLHDFPIIILPRRVTNPAASPVPGGRRL